MMMEELESSMNKAIEHLKKELIKIRAGKASPTMLQGVTVEAYGMQTPLNQVANISVPDARIGSIPSAGKLSFVAKYS